MERKNKYKIGDKLWTLSDKKIIQVMINGITVSKFKDITLSKETGDEAQYSTITYRLATENFINTYTDISETWLEDEFFKTKQELVDSLLTQKTED